MKFNEFMAHLAVALNDRLPEYTEVLRAVREGIDDGLETTERKLARMAADEGYRFDWGSGTFKLLLHAKSGPGGGLETTPTVLAFFLTAYLLDCPRREVAAQALAMTFAACAKIAPPPRWVASPIIPQALPGKKGRAICAKTKERYFGAAFVGVLSDRALFDQTAEVAICAELGFAQIVFEDGTASRFYTPIYYTKPAGTYSVRHLWLEPMRHLFDLINPPQPATQAPTRKRLVKA
jgi:hypothetical protein